MVEIGTNQRNAVNGLAADFLIGLVPGRNQDIQIVRGNPEFLRALRLSIRITVALSRIQAGNPAGGLANGHPLIGLRANETSYRHGRPNRNHRRTGQIHDRLGCIFQHHVAAGGIQAHRHVARLTACQDAKRSRQRRGLGVVEGAHLDGDAARAEAAQRPGIIRVGHGGIALDGPVTDLAGGRIDSNVPAEIGRKDAVSVVVIAHREAANGLNRACIDGDVQGKGPGPLGSRVLDGRSTVAQIRHIDRYRRPGGACEHGRDHDENDLSHSALLPNSSFFSSSQSPYSAQSWSFSSLPGPESRRLFDKRNITLRPAGTAGNHLNSVA